MWSICLQDLGTDFLVGNMVFVGAANNFNNNNKKAWYAFFFGISQDVLRTAIQHNEALLGMFPSLPRSVTHRPAVSSCRP